MRKPRGYWNILTCCNEAKKFKTRNDFKHGNETAYNVARRNGWLKDYDWLLPQLEIWTFEKCSEIAKQCVTKADFKKTNYKAYQSAHHNGWLDKFDWLLDGRYYNSNGEKKVKSKRRFNNALEYKGKSHCVYAYEFADKAVYVGLTLIRRIKDRDFEHIFNNDSVSKYANDNNIDIPEMKIILSGLTPLEARIKEFEVLTEYVNNGWKAINKAKTGSLGSFMHGYWTKERCIEEGKKYKTIKEYQKGNSSSYYAARVNGWLSEFTWFEHKTHPSGYWNYKNCYKEAQKYDSRISFCHGSHAAYESARTNKWLDDYIWFKYKKQKPKGFWTYETCFAEAKKYRSRTEFGHNCSRAYSISVQNGWIKDFTWLDKNYGQLSLFD